MRALSDLIKETHVREICFRWGFKPHLKSFLYRQDSIFGGNILS